jgi:hypothetical protein
VCVWPCLTRHAVRPHRLAVPGRGVPVEPPQLLGVPAAATAALGRASAPQVSRPLLDQAPCRASLLLLIRACLGAPRLIRRLKDSSIASGRGPGHECAHLARLVRLTSWSSPAVSGQSIALTSHSHNGWRLVVTAHRDLSYDLADASKWEPVFEERGARVSAWRAAGQILPAAVTQLGQCPTSPSQQCACCWLGRLSSRCSKLALLVARALRAEAMRMARRRRCCARRRAGGAWREATRAAAAVMGSASPSRSVCSRAWQLCMLALHALQAALACASALLALS